MIFYVHLCGVILILILISPPPPAGASWGLLTQWDSSEVEVWSSITSEHVQIIDTVTETEQLGTANNSQNLFHKPHWDLAPIDRETWFILTHKDWIWLMSLLRAKERSEEEEDEFEYLRHSRRSSLSQVRRRSFLVVWWIFDSVPPPPSMVVIGATKQSSVLETKCEKLVNKVSNEKLI